MLELEGNKIILKEFSYENLHDPRYFNWLRDLDIVTAIYRIEYLMPMQFSEIEKYVTTLLNSKNDCFFAIYCKEDNEFIGTLRIGHIDWRAGIADVGIMIGNKSYWRKGLAKDSVRTACIYAFKNLGLRKLTGGTPENNIAMCRCFERLGFKEEGRLRKQLLLNGEQIDHILFGILREEFKDNPD